MLRLRIITISILLPLFIWLLIFSSSTIFLWVTTIIISLATIEWLKLLKINNLIKFIFLLIYFFILYDIIKNNNWIFHSTSNIYFIIKIAAVFWVMAFLKILLFSLQRKHANTNTNTTFFLISAVFAVIPSWLAINYLKIHNKHLLVLGCSIVMAADIGAYIVGKLFGKHKLTTISPGKTWEGVFGGYIGSLLVCAIYMVICNINLKLPNILSFLLLTSVTFIFSVVGDLFESLLKRVANVKDSGTILPGHGGILDRIDSFCSGIPMFLLIFLILDKYILL